MWSDPLDLGGTALDSYIIEMDQGTTNGVNSFTIVQIQTNEASDTYYTSTYLNNQAVAKSLVAGDIYKFRVTARNVVGDSPVSNTFSAMAASLSSAPGTPTR